MYRWSNPAEMTDTELRWARRVLSDYLDLMSMWVAHNATFLKANVHLAEHQFGEVDAECQRRGLRA